MNKKQDTRVLGMDQHDLNIFMKRYRITSYNVCYTKLLRLLILDEPTRGVDVGAKSEIHALMSKFAAEGMAIIMVSSELPEVMGMSDRILIYHEGRINRNNVV